MQFVLDDEDAINLNVGLMLDGKVAPIRGSRAGRPNLNSIDKALMSADKALIGVPSKEIAKEHGIDTSTVNKSAKSDEPVKNRIIGMLRDRLETAVTNFNPDMIPQKSLPGAINQIAQALGKVEGNTEEGGKTVVFNVYAPRLRSEDEFDVIEVN